MLSSRAGAGQLFGEADTGIELLLDCPLRTQAIKVPTTLRRITRNRIMPYRFIEYERGLPPPHAGQAFSFSYH